MQYRDTACNLAGEAHTLTFQLLGAERRILSKIDTPLTKETISTVKVEPCLLLVLKIDQRESLFGLGPGQRKDQGSNLQKKKKILLLEPWTFSVTQRRGKCSG